MRSKKGSKIIFNIFSRNWKKKVKREIENKIKVKELRIYYKKKILNQEYSKKDKRRKEWKKTKRFLKRLRTRERKGDW